MPRTPDPKHGHLSIEDEMAADCLAMRVRLLGRTVTGIYEDALRPLGITVGQLNVLALVAKRGPVAPSEVARILNMDKSTVSRTVERMRQHDWLAVDAGGAGRQQHLSIRPRGRRLLERTAPAWREAQNATQSLLGVRETRALRRAADAAWGRLRR